MATEWFYQLPDHVVGPLSPSEMVRDIRAGKIAYDTPVRKDDSKWVSASDVGGLFDAAIRNVAEFRCPFCGTRIPKPPADCDACTQRVDATYLIQAAFPKALDAHDGSANGNSVKNVTRWARSLFGKNPT